MHTYELMIIFDMDAADTERDGILNSLEKAIQDLSGSITHRDIWGMRTFAYKINHKEQGFYVVLEFEAKGEMTELDRLLLLADSVVRHKILRLPDEEAQKRSQERSGEKQPESVSPVSHAEEIAK